MKSLFVFFMITVSVSLLLNFGGVISDNEWTTTSLIVDLFSGVSLTSSQIYTQVAIIVTALLIAVGANTFTGGSSGAGITIVKTAFVGWLATIIVDLVSLVNKVRPSDMSANGINTITFYIIFILGGLLIIGYIYSLIDFLFEND